MNQYIKKNLGKIISIFLLLQPILDLLTGLCVNLLDINITIGIIIRLLFLGFIVYITTFVYKKKSSLYVYLSVLVYSLLYLLGVIIYKDGVVFTELQGLFKVLYFPLILMSLYDLKDEYRISLMTLFATLFMYLILIFIPNLFGVGFESYEVAKSGNLGFFNSANEISAIISLLTPIMFIIIKELKNNFLKVVYILLYLVIILTIGTKTPLLALMITLGMAFLYYLVVWFKQKKYKAIFYTSTIIVIGLSSLLLILPKTTFYKNIKIHLDFLEVDSITDVLKDKRLIDHFIFSQRLTFLEDKALIYADSSLYENFFGIGYTADKETTKLIEMDYFDILYSHGIIGFTLVFTIYGLILYNVLKEKTKLTFKNYMLKVSVALIIILALLTGHIITAPAVSIIAIILILELYPHPKKNLLFAAVNLDIGGIESALITLVNKINKNKYSVDIVLEEKRGILLSRLAADVNVSELKVATNKNVFIRKATNLYRKLLFTIFNYQNYDFSCCYATYSYSCNKLALVASKNNAFYVHSNYQNIYKDKKDYVQFFNSRNVETFKDIIFVANEAKDAFVKEYPHLKKKCKVFNNFIDTDLIKEKSQEKIDIRKDKNKVTLVFVGRLEDHSKKLSRAINLVKKLDNLSLWIIGDGPDRKLYEDLVKKEKLGKAVTFLGKKANPYPYILKADYVILTSDYEGFPVTYLEAITLEKPVITTIDVSDDQINVGKDYAEIVSKDENKMVTEVKKIIKKRSKTKKIDLDALQEKRMKELEKLFNEVID